jgi:hypothetical protein
VTICDCIFILTLLMPLPLLFIFARRCKTSLRPSHTDQYPQRRSVSSIDDDSFLNGIFLKHKFFFPLQNTHPSNGGPTIPPQHYSGPPSLTSALPSTLPYSSASSAQHRTAPSTVGATAASSSVTKGGISIVEARPGPGGAHARGGTSRKRTPK